MLCQISASLPSQLPRLRGLNPGIFLWSLDEEQTRRTIFVIRSMNTLNIT